MSLLMQMIILMIPIVFVVFWFWMFQDMTTTDDLPPCFLTFTSGTNTKFDWTIAFVFLNLFTALYYYFGVYRNRS